MLKLFFLSVLWRSSVTRTIAPDQAPEWFYREMETYLTRVEEGDHFSDILEELAVFDAQAAKRLTVRAFELLSADLTKSARKHAREMRRAARAGTRKKVHSRRRKRRPPKSHAEPSALPGDSATQPKAEAINVENETGAESEPPLNLIEDDWSTIGEDPAC